MSERGILIVVSGFSGAGKGTLMKELLRRYDCCALSVSATTRCPREGEQDGREYFFLTRERFLEMIAGGELYEWAEYQGNFYGTPRAYVDDQLKDGKDVILEIEVQGAEKIKRQFPDTVLIFVAPPSAAELKRRLIGRGSETEESAGGRLARALEEAAYMPAYDYILINDDLEKSTEELYGIIRAEHARSARSAALIAAVTEDLRRTVS